MYKVHNDKVPESVWDIINEKMKNGENLHFCGKKGTVCSFLYSISDFDMVVDVSESWSGEINPVIDGPSIVISWDERN